MHSEDRAFEKFTHRKKAKNSSLGKKQMKRAKRGSRHETKQKLNDSIYRPFEQE